MLELANIPSYALAGYLVSVTTLCTLFLVFMDEIPENEKKPHWTIILCTIIFMWPLISLSILWSTLIFIKNEIYKASFAAQHFNIERKIKRYFRVRQHRKHLQQKIKTMKRIIKIQDEAGLNPHKKTKEVQ